MIPTTTSLIFTPPDPDDIEDEHAALEETADGHAVGNRVERDLDGG
jgi:hypothetical protein